MAKKETIKIPASRRLAEKAEFIHAVARYLSANQAAKSIALEVEQRIPCPVGWAKEWAEVRGASLVRGYPTVDEVEAALWELLG